LNRKSKMPTLNTKTQLFRKIALTTGDPNGIGLEVCAKALRDFSKNRKASVLFFLFRDHLQEKKQPGLFKVMDSCFTRITFFDLSLALAFAKTLTRKDVLQKRILIDLCLKSSAADWVFQATEACIEKKLDSLVTGPLSKTLIRKFGYNQLGHTGIFRSYFPKTPLHMAFVGKDFHVLLVTDHISLSKVEESLTLSNMRAAFKSALKLKKTLGSKKPIGILGLNPHAGEDGLIGHKEKSLFKRLPKGFVGPLVPDAAFLKKNWSKYSLFICLYHDQGLIPFKMHHRQDAGVHITMGLPFVRTSVDHGTAFDIYNKNLANSASMLDSINLNLKLLES
jgi:4-hydroxy-L-threonine phosphate dehydrogenase PdxA